MARSDHAVLLRAWQPAFERNVGVRLLPRTSIEVLDDDFRRAGALAGHPNVVTVHGFGATGDGVPYVVTELLEQGSLADLVRRNGPLDWYEAASTTVKVAGVLVAAAEAGVDPPRITPGDVLLSRFGEPKVAVVGGPPSPGGEGVDSLLVLLRALLGDHPPAALEPTLDGRATGVTELVGQLQRAQAAAGRAVTELPRASRATAPLRPGDREGFSEALTVASERRAPAGDRPGRAAVIGLVALTLVTVTLAARNDRPPPTASVTTPPPVSSGPAPVAGPADPPLHSANFAPPPGTNLTGPDRFVDGELRARIDGRSGRSLAAWRAPSAEHRLSLSVTARLSLSVTASTSAAPPAHVALVCGALSPGEKHFAAWVAADGDWRIEANGQVMGRGSAPERQAELREAFVLRLDCATDRSPTAATLLLNGTALGAVDGPEPFPIPFASFFARADGEEGVDLAVRAFTVRRLT